MTKTPLYSDATKKKYYTLSNASILNRRSMLPAFVIFISFSIWNALIVRRIKTPWDRIIRSKGVWALWINMFTTSWSGYLFLSWLPTYMDKVYELRMVILFI
jgi:hypothetical protein